MAIILKNPKINVILIDMDNTLNNFSLGFETYVKKLGYSINPSYCGDDSYHVEEMILASTKKEQKRIMNHIFSLPEYWIDLPILPHAKEILIELANSGYSLNIATALWREGDIKYKKPKLSWLEYHGLLGIFDNIYFKREKWELEGDILIDDKKENLEKFPNITIKYNHPYNKSVNTDYSFSDWREIPVIVGNI